MYVVSIPLGLLCILSSLKEIQLNRLVNSPLFRSVVSLLISILEPHDIREISQGISR